MHIAANQILLILARTVLTHFLLRLSLALTIISPPMHILTIIALIPPFILALDIAANRQIPIPAPTIIASFPEPILALNITAHKHVLMDASTIIALFPVLIFASNITTQQIILISPKAILTNFLVRIFLAFTKIFVFVVRITFIAFWIFSIFP